MYRVELYPIEDPCKYQCIAITYFTDFARFIGAKYKKEKNGIGKWWFKNKDFKIIKFFLDQLRCESVPHRSFKLK